MRRPLRILLAAALGSLALAGCGNKEKVVTEAATEGIWLDVGALDYHIQGSRQLNPAQVPDDKYLTGLPQGILPPGAKETWFGVFVRIENRTKLSHPTATEFEVVDTEEHVYKPMELRAEENPFAYQPRVLTPDAVLPAPDSSQDLSSTAGALLLFKIPLDSYQNRPLELRIKAPADPHAGSPDEAPPSATLDLDV
jgi:hypothetical protein